MLVRNFVTLSLFLSSAMAGPVKERALRGDVDSRSLQDIFSEASENTQEIEVDMSDMPPGSTKDISDMLDLPEGSAMVYEGENGDAKIEIMNPGERRLRGEDAGRDLQLGANSGLGLRGSTTIKLILFGWCVQTNVAWDFVAGGCLFDGFVRHIEAEHAGEDPLGPVLPFNFLVGPAFGTNFIQTPLMCMNHPGPYNPNHQDCKSAAASYTPNVSCWVTTTYAHTYVTGEPHFAQFSGKKFDYQGQCDLVYLNAPDFDDGAGMDIHIRTKIRGDYSYIETAAVRIGSDIFEVSSFGDYFLNGVLRADLRFATIAGRKITYEQPEAIKSFFKIDLGGGHILKLSVIKDIVSVLFESDDPTENDLEYLYKWFSTAGGMVGNMQHYGFLARDGVTLIKNPNAFADEWQCRDSDPKLFQVLDHAPQYPEKCVLPTASETGRRLGETISEEAAAKACENWPEDQKDNCIYDVMAIGSLDLALAGSY